MLTWARKLDITSLLAYLANHWATVGAIINLFTKVNFQIFIADNNQ